MADEQSLEDRDYYLDKDPAHIEFKVSDNQGLGLYDSD
jgi:hypothetical protein